MAVLVRWVAHGCQGLPVTSCGYDLVLDHPWLQEIACGIWEIAHGMQEIAHGYGGLPMVFSGHT